MRTQLAERSPSLARPRAGPVPAAILAQRHSTLGGGSVTAPPIRDAGRPLEPATRGAMEQGFGRDFGAIRVHDDARAHDDARSLGALAYAAGNDIVFAQGRYTPQTAAGRALIAHELAHSVQQGGVQMKADGSLPVGADARLEAEADHAASAVIAGRSAPSLSRVGAPAVFRNTEQVAAASDTKSEVVGDEIVLEDGGKAYVRAEDPRGPGATYIAVEMPTLKVPNKGKGEWVQQAYTDAISSRILMFDAQVVGDKIQAVIPYVSATYPKVWLKKHGFVALSGVEKAFQGAKASSEVAGAFANPEVAALLTSFQGESQGLCDIDHIVEKQVGGNNQPNNIQLLGQSRNRSAGSTLQSRLESLAGQVHRARPTVTNIQLRFPSATLDGSAAVDLNSDASFIIETLLRGPVKGDAMVKAQAEGTPVGLVAAGNTAVTNIRSSGTTLVDFAAAGLIKGAKLLSYKRASKSAKGKVGDTVTAELATPALRPGRDQIVIPAIPVAAPVAAPAAAPSAGGDAIAQPGEYRELIIPEKMKEILAECLVMSPVSLTELKLDPQGNLSGAGTIKPTLSFFPSFIVRFTPTTLEAVVPIPAKKMPSTTAFRFTEGELGLKIVPDFIPTSTLKFTLGPEQKPLIQGDFVAKYEGGAFVATATLIPAPGRKIPGIDNATGTAQYDSRKGWSGELKASSSAIPASKADVAIGFKQPIGGAFAPYASGQIVTQIRGNTLKLNAGWADDDLSFDGEATIPDPFPLVKQVILGGTYSKGILRMSGHGDLVLPFLTASMTIGYVRKDGETEGKFSGSAAFNKKTPQYDYAFALKYSEAGKLTASGTISYQITKDIRPTLGIELTEDRKLKMTGEAKLADMSFGKAWPQPPDNEKKLIAVGYSIKIPTPLVVVNAMCNIKAGLGVKFGVGPVVLKGVTFTGSLYPFEKDLRITAALKGSLSVPAFGDLVGTISATLGVEVVGGALAAEGGIRAKPSLDVKAEGVLDVNAAYQSGGFSFSAEAYAKAQMVAKLDIDVLAVVSAGYGYWSHEWKYQIASFEKNLGPELKLTLGKIAYTKEGAMTWPSLSQIKIEPDSLDPRTIVRELMADAKDKDSGKTVKK